MNLVKDYNTKFSRGNYDNILDQNKECIKYITIIQHNCLIPQRLKKNTIQRLIIILQKNRNFLHAYFYRIDDFVHFRKIVNNDYNTQLIILINKEINKISNFLDTIQHLSRFIH